MDAVNHSRRLSEGVDRFPKAQVLIIGDVMLDEFIWGTVDRISPEAPVPVVNVTGATRLLGGAANVLNNIVSAGGRALLCGAVGQDREGREIIKMLRTLGCDPQGIVVDPGRPTTIKTRVIAHAQQVVRFDREDRVSLDRGVTENIIAFLGRKAEEVDAVIIADYGKGLVTRPLMNAVRRYFSPEERIVAVDPKVNNFKLYRKVTVITPNHHEAAAGSGVTIDSERALRRAGRKIIRDLDCGSVLITRGEQGMTLFEKDGPTTHIPTVAREVFDVTGAGDTVIAILTLALATGLPLREAAELSNFAAGSVVGEVGTSAVTAEQLKEAVLAGARRSAATSPKSAERSRGRRSP